MSCSSFVVLLLSFVTFPPVVCVTFPPTKGQCEKSPFLRLGEKNGSSRSFGLARSFTTTTTTTT